MTSDYLPRRDADLAAWGAAASAKISSDPISLGVDTAMAARLASKLADFAAALAAANAPTTRGPARTLAKEQTRRDFVDYARLVVRQIQGTASVTDAQRQSLGITVRKERAASARSPGTPERFTMTLNVGGTLTLAWRCANPPGARGTLYQVYRRLENAGDYVHVGGVGEKSFTDATIPARTHAVSYRVQAVRSTSAGEPADVNVTFGGAADTRTPTFRAAA